MMRSTATPVKHPCVNGESPRFDRRDLACCAILLLAGVLVLGKGLTVGGLRWGDAGTHAMDGVLIHDWVAAGPSAWPDPVGFAERQYAHYPSLGIGSTYPPGFAVVEAVFFAIFGISITTARLCVLGFAMLALGGLYVLARRSTGRLCAACAVLALLSMSSFVLWSRQIMLETPTAAVLIWSAVTAQRYADRPTWSRLALWTALSVSAVLFKQTAAFILLPYALLLIAWNIRGKAPLRHTVAAGLASVGSVAAYFTLISSGGAGPQVLSYLLDGRSASSLFSAQSWLQYGQWMPQQVGVCVIVLAVLGLVLSLRRFNLLSAMALLWFATFYAMSSLIQHQEHRYFFFGLPPIALWAGIGAGWLIARIRPAPARACAVTCVTLAALVSAFLEPVPYRPDYGPLVSAHADRITGKIVLFDGHRDSDFILAVRQQLGPRKCVVVRASKLLYACAASPKDRFESFVESLEQVNTTLRNLAFDGVFVEREPRMKLDEEQLLRQSLKSSGDYALLTSHTLRAGPGIERTPRTVVDVDVYLPRSDLRRQTDVLQIPIPMDNRVLSVDLDELATDT